MSSRWLTAVLLAVVGINSGALEAHGQNVGALTEGASSIIRNDDGSVFVDTNAFDVRTGELENGSDIPLLRILPTNIVEGQAQPVDRSREVPNNIEITPDLPFIEESFEAEASRGDTTANYRLETDSVNIQTRFDLRYRRGDHNFGEGIEVTVLGPDGEVKSRERVFVRGDRITVGPDGPLPESAQIEASYGAEDRVELRVLNIREDGGVVQESGIYFAEDGEFVVEDLQNGGDLDFDDGEYVRIPGGDGAAVAVETLTEATRDTQTDETPLDPEMRAVESEIVEEDRVVESDTIVEEVSRDYGSVEYSTTTVPSLFIGHARGARSATGELLIYDRYSANSEVRLGTDGLGATGQLSPLFNDPGAPPTLLTGNVSFNPFVGDNEALVTTSIGITQFITPTHRRALDALGNEIINPLDGGKPLVEPIGLFNNRRMVGFVRDIPETVSYGDPLVSENGVFTLPGGPVVIEPANPERVGRGDAAYENNVGGVLLDNTDGSMTFIPQWNGSGYVDESISLEGGTTARVIYALVPQQSGQNLQLGERYAVTRGAANHTITDGGFTVISADRHFQNFLQEDSEVYAVEDTLASGNARTALFNGVQGRYAEVFGGERIATVDVNIESEADARVGNTLVPEEIIAGVQGQEAFSQTTLAAGLYLTGSVTGGFGNQRDAVVRNETTQTVENDRRVTRRVRDTFMVPRTQRDEVVFETSQTTERRGQATFTISSDGLLQNVNFQPLETLSTSDATTSEVERNSTVVTGTETLMAREVLEEDVEVLNSRVLEADQETNSGSDSYVNFAPVRGEAAFGGVLNFGNTPWSPAANTMKVELFARDTVVGRGSGGSETGYRAEVIFHPFGEERQEGFRYDGVGNMVPLFETEAVMGPDGQPEMEAMETADGETVEVPVNQFVTDENGERVPMMVGTGKSKGPGAYIRFEDVFDDGGSAILAGGIQFNF